MTTQIAASPIAHDHFTITRTIAAAPDTVFRAYADADLKTRWFAPSVQDPADRNYRLDFRIGGTEHSEFVVAEGPGAGRHANDSVFLDIIQNRRIAHAYTMSWDGRIHSASLVTTTFEPVEAGCRLTVTEQGSYFEGSDGPEMRRAGTDQLLDALSALFS